MNEIGTIIWLICLNLLDFAMQGATTLPLIMILALAMGRKENGAFCLFATLRLGYFTLWLSFTGPAYFTCSYLYTMIGMGNHHFLDTFFLPAAMNYSISLLAWLAGMFLFYLAWINLREASARFGKHIDRYDLKTIKFAVMFLILSGFCYFMTFIIIHWPFAGYPASLTRERVIMAILRNGARNWFMALAPAGVLASIFAVWKGNEQTGIATDTITGSIRWCAFWAFIGYLPVTLQNTGILIGASAGAYKNFVAGYYALITGVMLTLCGMACFALLLLRKKTPAWFAFPGLILYLGAKILPKILFNTVYNL